MIPLKAFHASKLGTLSPTAYRNKGHAQNAVGAAIAELEQGLARNKISTVYVEALVGIDNEASKHVADATIASAPVEVIDQVSGLPALYYVRKIR